jgi:hypothetical protein
MKVRLLKDLEHAGQPHPAGSVPDLPKETAEWLIAQGAAVASKTTKPKETNDHGNE